MVTQDPSVAEHNEHEIAMLQRWRLRSSILFFLSLAEIPLTVIASCVATGIINMRGLGLQYAQIAMLCAVLLPLVGLAVALLMHFDRKHSRRALELAQFAQGNGMRYSYRAEPDDMELTRSFKFVNLQRLAEGGSGLNLLQGKFKKRALIAVDYSFNHYYGNKLKNTRQTVVVFTDRLESLPDFAVVKQGFGAKLEQLIAGTPFGKKIKMPDEDEFNREFVVAGNSRKEIVARMTPAVIELLLSEPSITFLVQGGMLMVARQDVIISSNEYEDFLAIASQLARKLGQVTA